MPGCAALPTVQKVAPNDARRAEICRTAAQIFRDRGYDATSVSDIARALGITKSGLYYYARIATDGHGAVAHLTDEIRALPASMRRKVEQRMRVYFDLARDTITGLKTEGRLRDVDPTVATFSLLGMILWLPRWFRQNGRLTQEQAAHEITSLALGGIVRPAAYRRRLRRIR